MDPEGCIPISLIATFNRVKALTQDIQLILMAVDVSDIVELVDGVKVLFVWLPYFLELRFTLYNLYCTRVSKRLVGVHSLNYRMKYNGVSI